MSGVAHAVRGSLIGLVELVPGVSGGTVALVLGIYDRLVLSARQLIGGAVRSTTRSIGRRGSAVPPPRFAGVEWSLILPLAVGMFLALFALSGPLHTFVEAQPVISKALFLGMVSASLLVPISMARDSLPSGPDRATVSRFVGAAVVLVVAAAVFKLLGLPTLVIGDPPGWVIALSGAAAVCALALPGLSGSFILLTFGMYEPTLEAVSSRNGSYLVVFIAGALVGLVSVVQLLAYLLRVHRRMVLLVATGLILGSLRALWPWQDGDAFLAPPAEGWAGPLIAFSAGAVGVLLLWWQDRRRASAGPVGGHA
ncbi:DUF368 domain-containing protein [Arthrobacter sp. MN05-02]|nr:DUF368 domain-containing protein [Arthrobacter sp. MN05-02]